MYITINDVIGEKRIDLSYPIKGKDIAVVSVTIWNIINLLFIAQVYSAWAHNCMYTWDCIIL